MLPMALDTLLSRRSHVRRESIATMLELSIEAAEVSFEDFIASVERDLGTERLTSAAIEASAETSFEPKLRSIADSLAEGLTAEGRSSVDLELLVIDALRALEPVHVWLLDRLVQWEPSIGGVLNGSTGPFGEAASVGIHAADAWDSAVPRKPWTIATLRSNFTRHQPPALFDAVLGTLIRHGIAVEVDRTEDLLQAIRTEVTGKARVQAQDLGSVVRVSEFGVDIHTRLLRAGAVEETQPGELDLDASLRGHRGLRYSAKISKYADALKIPLADALALEALPKGRSGGYQIPTRSDPSPDNPSSEDPKSASP